VTLELFFAKVLQVAACFTSRTRAAITKGFYAGLELKTLFGLGGICLAGLLEGCWRRLELLRALKEEFDRLLLL